MKEDYMQHIITPIKKLVSKMVSEKEFIPVEMKYPGFSISQEACVSLLENYLQNMIHIKVDTKQYKSKFLLNENEDFTDLIKADLQKTSNVRLQSILEKALPADIEKDMQLHRKHTQAHARQAILKGLSHHIKASILQLNILENSYPNEKDPLEKPNAVSKLASMLIYLKDKNPIAFKNIEEELAINPLQDTVKNILTEVNEPSSPTVYNLFKFDKSFVKENFSKQFLLLQDMSEKNNLILKNKIDDIRSKTTMKKKLFSFS